MAAKAAAWQAKAEAEAEAEAVSGGTDCGGIFVPYFKSRRAARGGRCKITDARDDRDGRTMVLQTLLPSRAALKWNVV